MKEGIHSAFVTGCFVLLGGLVAAAASIGTTLVVQHGEEERIDQEARGAARILVNRFATTIASIDVALDQGSAANITSWLDSSVPAGDLKLITARLSFEDFRAVEGALRNTTNLLSQMEVAPDDGLSREGRGALREWRASLVRAIPALSQVAEWGDVSLPDQEGRPLEAKREMSD